MSNGAEDDAKSVEVGTREVGHQSNLKGGQSSAQVGELWKAKCDIYSDWCYIMHSLM